MKSLSLIGSISMMLLTTACGAHHINKVENSQPKPSVKVGHYKPIGNEGNSSGDWAWNEHIPWNDWSFNMTDTKAAKGNLSQRFELRNGDCTVREDGSEGTFGCRTGRERAEVIGKRFRRGVDQWWGFSVMMDDEWNTLENNHCTSIFQIKQTENVNQSNHQSKDWNNHYIGVHSVAAGYVCGDTVGIQLFKTGYDEGKSKFSGWVDFQFIPIVPVDAIRGQWNDIVIHWDTSDYKNQYSNFEIFVNGDKVGQWENITSNYFPTNYMFKYGPYRSHMKSRGVVSDTQVIYFDEMRFGNSYEEVTPAGKAALD